MSNETEFLWSQRYRPQTINDCILPQATKTILNGFVEQGQIPNILFAGSAGTGKTTAAYAIANELGADVLFINASLDTGIDVVRTKLTQFASTTSLEGNLKIVILDEAERGSAAFQDGLKSFMETFSQNTRFILTTNNKNKIIDPIISRCTTIDFKIDNSEKQKLAIQLMKRLKMVLSENGIQFDPKILSEVILKYFPDFRRTINELQRYSAGGIIDIGILSALSSDTIDELVGFLKNKDFKNARKWVANNSDVDSTDFFKSIYTKCLVDMRPESIPEMVLILAKYSFQSTLVLDHELNNIACLIELMGSCTWL